MVVFNDPGSVPENWRLISEEGLETGIPVTLPSHVVPVISISASSSSDGMEGRRQTGYCSRCRNGKPPRCHHCSICM